MKPSRVELDVLILRAEGLSNEEAAEALFVTVGTVKQRLRRAKVKLGTYDTAHSIAQCYRLGFMPLEVVSDAAA